jgi:DnaK suppressor protein
MTLARAGGRLRLWLRTAGGIKVHSGKMSKRGCWVPKATTTDTKKKPVAKSAAGAATKKTVTKAAAKVSSAKSAPAKSVPAKESKAAADKAKPKAKSMSPAKAATAKTTQAIATKGAASTKVAAKAKAETVKVKAETAKVKSETSKVADAAKTKKESATAKAKSVVKKAAAKVAPKKSEPARETQLAKAITEKPKTDTKVSTSPKAKDEPTKPTLKKVDEKPKSKASDTTSSAKAGPTKAVLVAKPMSQAAIAKDPFLSQQQAALLAEKEEYLAQAASLRQEADQMAADAEPGDTQFDEESGEGGTAAVDREHNLRLVAQAMSVVEEIDRALEKMTKGTYGLCEHCGEPIAQPRLEALPFAALCIACKSGGLTRR